MSYSVLYNGLPLLGGWGRTRLEMYIKSEARKLLENAAESSAPAPMLLRGPVRYPGDCPGRFVTFDLLEPYPLTLLLIGSPLFCQSRTGNHFAMPEC